MWCDEKCRGASGGGGWDEFRLEEIPVTAEVWQGPSDTTPPHNIGASWFSGAHASATITYSTLPSTGSWQHVQLGTVGDSDVPLDDLGAGVVNLLGQNAHAQKAFIGKFAAAAVTTAVVAPVAAEVGTAALNRVALGPSTGRLFYSAGQVYRAANSGAGQLLEGTPAGRALTAASKFLPANIQAAGWSALSKYWASGASGPVTAFGGSVFNVGSHFIQDELPALLRNPNITRPIMYR